MYRNHKVIQVNTMRIKDLAVTAGQTERAEKGHVAKDLPVIHLDRIDIDKIRFNQTSSNGNLSLDGERLCVDDINSLKHSFTWGNAEGLFKNIVINKPDVKAHIQTVNLNTQTETAITQCGFGNQAIEAAALTSLSRQYTPGSIYTPATSPTYNSHR